MAVAIIYLNKIVISEYDLIFVIYLWIADVIVIAQL